jgi:hypothetical protein
MVICEAIFKYNINNFSLYILEIIEKEKSKEYLSEKENFWYGLIKPSYNIHPKVVFYNLLQVQIIIDLVKLSQKI